jgi:integrase
MGEKRLDNQLRGYTTEEIQRLPNVTDVKYRAIILLLASTGMRREALVGITQKDIEYLRENKLNKIRIYVNTKDEQICLCTPEGAEALNLYLHMKKDDRHKELFWFKTVLYLTMILRQISIRAEVSEQHHKITKNKGEKIG